MANWLLERKKTVVGIIKTNHKGRGDLKRMEDRERVKIQKSNGRKIKVTIAIIIITIITITIPCYVVNINSSGEHNVLVLATSNNKSCFSSNKR